MCSYPGVYARPQQNVVFIKVQLQGQNNKAYENSSAIWHSQKWVTIFYNIKKTTWQNILKVNKIQVTFDWAISILEIHFKEKKYTVFCTKMLFTVSFIIKKYHKTNNRWSVKYSMSQLYTVYCLNAVGSH